MDSIQIMVTTETLIEVSNDLENKVTKTYETFLEIEEIISATTSYWEGEGQQQMAVGYSRRSDDFNRVFEKIRKHSHRLGEMAGIYSQAEKDVTMVAGILATDAIS